MPNGLRPLFNDYSNVYLPPAHYNAQDDTKRLFIANYFHYNQEIATRLRESYTVEYDLQMTVDHFPDYHNNACLRKSDLPCEIFACEYVPFVAPYCVPALDIGVFHLYNLRVLPKSNIGYSLSSNFVNTVLAMACNDKGCYVSTKYCIFDIHTYKDINGFTSCTYEGPFPLYRVLEHLPVLINITPNERFTISDYTKAFMTPQPVSLTQRLAYSLQAIPHHSVNDCYNFVYRNNEVANVPEDTSNSSIGLLYKIYNYFRTLEKYLVKSLTTLNSIHDVLNNSKLFVLRVYQEFYVIGSLFVKFFVPFVDVIPFVLPVYFCLQNTLMTIVYCVALVVVKISICE